MGKSCRPLPLPDLSTWRLTVKDRRRPPIDPQRAREAAAGGWVRSIPVNSTGWPTCSEYGVKGAVVDHRSGECLRSKPNMVRDGEQGDRAR